MNVASRICAGAGLWLTGLSLGGLLEPAAWQRVSGMLMMGGVWLAYSGAAAAEKAKRP